jgi:hypothetical protein
MTTYPLTDAGSVRAGGNFSPTGSWPAERGLRGRCVRSAEEVEKSGPSHPTLSTHWHLLLWLSQGVRHQVGPEWQGQGKPGR